MRENIIKLSSPGTREYWEIPVVFEDNHLLALDKPAHLLTSPDRCDPERPNLMKLLHRDIARNTAWARGRQLTYLANAHRLDFETSGVILLAKDKPSLISLANQFGSDKPRNTYIALAVGSPSNDQFEINAKLAPHPVKVGLMRIDPNRGKKSHTHFEVVERFRGYTVFKCELAMGRPHQIRVHLKRAGCPVAGDALYGGRQLFLSSLKPDYRAKQNEPERPLIGRVALHAAELTILHPMNATPVKIASPWPKDISVAVKYLRRFAAV